MHVIPRKAVKFPAVFSPLQLSSQPVCLLFRETRQLSASINLRAKAGQNFAIGGRSQKEHTGASLVASTSSVVFVVLEHVRMGWDMRG